MLIIQKKTQYKKNKASYQKSLPLRFLYNWLNFQKKKNCFLFFTKIGFFLTRMRKRSNNMVFFDFRKVYRPAEISGKKKFSPKIGQNVYFQAHRILKTCAQNLVKIWRFVRGGRPFPPTSSKGIIRKIV